MSVVDYQNIPFGFVMGMAMHNDAETAFQKLTEAEKEKIIMECRDAESKQDMDRIINRLTGKIF